MIAHAPHAARDNMSNAPLRPIAPRAWQMRERERERVRQLELQDQEREAMLRQNADMKEEEIRQVVAKKEAGKKLLEEVAASNAEQIELKKVRAPSRRRDPDTQPLTKLLDTMMDNAERVPHPRARQ